MAARPILSIVVTTALASAGHASPRSDPTAGRAVFTGATMANATSIMLNPAAAGLGGDGRGPASGEVFAAITSALDQLSIDREELDPETGALAPGERVKSATLSPGALFGVIIRAGGRYTLGVQLQTPPRERFLAGHEALRYHVLGGGQRDYLATISGAIRITSRVYFGASVTHDNTRLQLRYARDAALAAGTGPRGIDSDCDGARCGIENPLATEHYDVDVRSPWIGTSNLRVNVGLVARVWRDVWIGLAYHTPPGFGIQTALTGSVDVTRAPRDGGEVIPGSSTVYVSFPASVDAEIRAALPRQLDLHVGGRWEDLSRMQAYDVRAYNSTFVRNGIPEWTLRPRGMHDSFAFWAGLEQIERDEERDRLRFGGRVGYETASLDDDATSPLTVSPASFTADVGAKFRLSSSWLVQLSYGVQLYSPVAAGTVFDPRHQLDCIASDFDYSTPACRAVREGYAIPTAAGDYTRIQHAARLGFVYELP